MSVGCGCCDRLVPLLLIRSTELLHLLPRLLISIITTDGKMHTTPHSIVSTVYPHIHWPCCAVLCCWSDKYQAAAPPNATAQASRFCVRERPVPVKRRPSGLTLAPRPLLPPLPLLGRGGGGGRGEVEACDIAKVVERGCYGQLKARSAELASLRCDERPSKHQSTTNGQHEAVWQRD